MLEAGTRKDRKFPSRKAHARPHKAGCGRTISRLSPFSFALFTVLFVGAITLAVVNPAASAAGNAETANGEKAHPVDVMFVLDNSGSMRQNDPQYLTREAVSNFARALSQAKDIDARIGVVLFDGTARLVQPLTPVGSGPADSDGATDGAVDAAMSVLDFSGQQTNSPAGVERALYELRENGREAGRRAIIFLSDGQIDTGDPQTDYDASWWLREELADESRALGIRIFSIAFTDEADYQLMQAVAQKTRASYYRAYKADQLGTVVADVVDKVAIADFYALAAAGSGTTTGLKPFPSPLKPTAVDGTPAGNGAPVAPDVASAPTASSLDLGSPIGLLAWMPVAVLLIAGTLLWRRQKPAQSVDALIAQAELDMDAPAAQLLDFGGQLGETGTSLPLKRGRNRIGRDKHNDIILDDDTISSEHAVIEVHDGRYWVEDRRSTNGTRIGDKRISPEQRVPLKGGDHIRFADIDLMFVLAGYVPGGATVFLDSSTTPPLGWRDQKPASEKREPTAPPQEDRPAAAADIAQLERDGKAAEVSRRAEVDQRDKNETGNRSAEVAEVASPVSALPDVAQPRPEAKTPGEAAKPASGTNAQNGAPAKEESKAVDDIAIASERERVDPAPVENLDESLVAAEEVPLRPAVPEQTEVVMPESPVDAYRECLDFHLARVEEISPAFEQFIGESFDPEIRDALALTGRELIERAQAGNDGTLCHKDYTSGAIRYVICGLVGEMDAAQACYVETFGGFTRMLTEQLQSESFRRDRCEILAVLTFGQNAGDDALPWVSLSVVPDEGQDPRIDLLSYEFLTAEERGEIESTIQPEPEQSHSGLG